MNISHIFCLLVTVSTDLSPVFNRKTTILSHYFPQTPKRFFLVRAGRIELPSRPWQGRVLPLNHARSVIFLANILN